jgi:hypothetical protein
MLLATRRLWCEAVFFRSSHPEMQDRQFECQQDCICALDGRRIRIPALIDVTRHCALGVSDCVGGHTCSRSVATTLAVSIRI